MNGWIGVDLDGTLAHYEKGYASKNIIGDPIPSMVSRIQRWIQEGITVKIFTARVYQTPDSVNLIQSWLLKNGLPKLEVTNEKDYNMLELWDDRCITIQHNTGIILTDIDAMR